MNLVDGHRKSQENVVLSHRSLKGLDTVVFWKNIPIAPLSCPLNKTPNPQRSWRFNPGFLIIYHIRQHALWSTEESSRSGIISISKMRIQPPRGEIISPGSHTPSYQWRWETKIALDAHHIQHPKCKYPTLGQGQPLPPPGLLHWIFSSLISHHFVREWVLLVPASPFTCTGTFPPFPKCLHSTPTPHVSLGWHITAIPKVFCAIAPVCPASRAPQKSYISGPSSTS